MTGISLCTLSHAVQYLAWSPGEGHAFYNDGKCNYKTGKGLDSDAEQWDNEVPALLCTQ